eukprot:TRINITY_DN110110_c0_g1_i1.p1 TRINITY_DN110110_c0_g1~~TRINITY_DN110110_c0_g1_i1.p1  ORF type:complete len:462 (-),score=93.58 TRINITY_DN110110_c0_g1_i1:281-1666(-)
MCITMCTCAVFGCSCTVLLVGFTAFCLLLVPQVSLEASRASWTHLSGTSLFLAQLGLTGRHFSYCLGDYLGCVKPLAAKEMVDIWGWETGVGLWVPFSFSQLYHGDKVIPLHFSHNAYRSWAHDVAAGRPPDMMVLSNKSSLPPGVLPELAPDILLNFDTGSQEHQARRKLLADMFPSLDKEAKLQPFKVPPGVKPSESNKKRAVFDYVAYNIYLSLFDVDIADELADHFEYDGLFTPAVIGVPIFGFQGRRMSEIRSKLFRKIETSAVGLRFMAGANERGMYGRQRLDEMVWIAMFAGYGGTSNLAFETLKMINKDPTIYVPLFRKDPEAFMLESARLHPPVAGMNPGQYRQPKEIQLATGGTFQVRAGMISMMLSSGANHDPVVFEEPAKFWPGRKNAGRLLSWNNEWDAFSSCETVAGCPAAPRGCPGAFLSLKVATGAVSYFLEGIEHELNSRRSEL